MSEIILHHYDASPYAEKVRCVLGMKQLNWHSVEIPNIMPKPDLMPLTGGYRKTPVMQIGADVYCDSQCIIRELERRYPKPSLLPKPHTGLAYGMGLWPDRHIFQADVAVIFAALKDFVPAEFIEDRKKLTSGTFDPEAFSQAAPHALEQLRGHFSLLELELRHNQTPFLAGEKAGLLDAHAYFVVWFLRGLVPHVLDQFSDLVHLKEWELRVKAIGHGTPMPLSSGQALEIAKNAQSSTLPEEDPLEPNGLKLGDQVQVMADDYGRDPVAGSLVRSSALDIAIKREHEQVGEVVVHFPRLGFIVNKI